MTNYAVQATVSVICERGIRIDLALQDMKNRYGITNFETVSDARGEVLAGASVPEAVDVPVEAVHPSPSRRPFDIHAGDDQIVAIECTIQCSTDRRLVLEVLDGASYFSALKRLKSRFVLNATAAVKKSYAYGGSGMQLGHRSAC